ncbi:MAG: MoaD/ThiS family protein [Planctomycetaceae bacterium]
MTVRVEFFGLARRTAGCAFLDVEAATLGDAIERIREELPQLASICFADRTLSAGYLANVNGKQFTRDPECPLKPGDSVLILSNDMGG